MQALGPGLFASLLYLTTFMHPPLSPPRTMCCTFPSPRCDELLLSLLSCLAFSPRLPLPLRLFVASQCRDPGHSHPPVSFLPQSSPSLPERFFKFGPAYPPQHTHRVQAIAGVPKGALSAAELGHPSKDPVVPAKGRRNVQEEGQRLGR